MVDDKQKCNNCIKSRLPCGPLIKPPGKRDPKIKTEAQFKKRLDFKVDHLRRERGMSYEAILSLLGQEDDEESLQEENRQISSEPTQEPSATSNSGLDTQSQGHESHESQEMTNQSLYEPYASLDSGYHFEHNDQQTQQMMHPFTRESYLSLNSPYQPSTNQQQTPESPELLNPVTQEFYPSLDGANSNGQQPPEFLVETPNFVSMTPDHTYLLDSYPFVGDCIAASVLDSDYDAFMTVSTFFLFVLM
jgi:hypothetical protein